MITRVYIKNFQCYKELDLYPGEVNIVIGPNNSGKSAVLRALRLALFNKPDGVDFVRFGEKEAIIELEYGSHIIKRTKGRSNVYEVDGSIFSSFGKDVPKEVLDVLGFSSIQVDRNIYELNFDSPHDPPFFISETDAMKGKIFSKLGERVLEDLVLLDTSIKSANAKVRQLTTSRTVLQEQVNEVTKELEKFVPISLLEEALNSCNTSINVATALEKEIDNLNEISSYYKQLVQEESLYVELATVDLVVVEASLKEASLLQDEILTLEGLQEELLEVTSQCSILSSLSVNESFDLETPAVVLKELKELEKSQASLLTIEVNITKSIDKLDKLEEELKVVVEEYRVTLQEEKVCPLCFRPVDEHNIEVILKELTC